jgi:hypothetical protein
VKTQASRGTGDDECRGAFGNRRSTFVVGKWWPISLAVIVGEMACFYAGGQRTRLPVVDGLDSYLPTHAVLARDEAFLGPLDSVFQPILGGIPRGCLPSETRVFLLFYRYLDPFQAYVVMEAVIRIAALAGMVLLLRRHVLPDAPAAAIFGPALCFALLPFYVHADLSVAGQPLLACALLNIRGKDNSRWNWLIVAGFPFVSSLPFIGFAVLPMVAVWIVVEWAAARKFPVGLGMALVLLTVGYCASDYRLVAQLAGGGRFVSHRSEFAREGLGLWRVMVHVAGILVTGDSYAPSLQNYVIAPAAVLALAIGLFHARREARVDGQPGRLKDGPGGPCGQRLLLLLILVLACEAISIWWGLCFSRAFTVLMDLPGFRALKMLQLQRLNWLHAALWTLVFAVSLRTIWTGVPLGRFVAWGLVAAQVAVALFAQYREHSQQPLTFAEFYSPGLFRDVRDFIGAPAANYRVASLGMHPAIALYNGFRTVDGYWVNYPLEYKHRFRRAIAGELAKDPKLAKYFDGFGSRCYLFSAELGQHYLYTKDSSKRRVERLDVDSGALAELGAKYILSAVDIGNATELGLNLKAVFQRSDSPWRIYLYALPKRQ